MTENTANIGFEKAIWDAACILRGNMDAAEYKQVVLGLIFLKYISDKFEARYQELVKEGEGFEEDRDEYTLCNVFFVPENARWKRIAEAAHTPEIGRIIDDAMILIEKENPRLKGILPKNFARPELDKRRLGDVVDLAHPNKRYLTQDVIVPGRYSESIGNLVVALDTSGSMTEDEIREVAGEIRGMVPSTQDITLIVADSVIQQVIPLEDLEEVLASGMFRGGGGTDHVCVFEYIARHHLNPRIFIGLSDLCSCFPEKKPPYPVLWLVPEIHADPPWGKVIEL